MKSSWRLSFLHLDCTFSCSIIDVSKAIVFFTANRKSKNFEILAREWRSSNGTSFYLLSTTLKTSSGAQSFGTLSLILRKREFINMPFYQIWLKVTAGIKTKTSQRHSRKLAQPQNLELERKLNIFFDISLDVEGLFGAPFYFLPDWSCSFTVFSFQSFVAVKNHDISIGAFLHTVTTSMLHMHKYHIWFSSMEGLCICFNTMMVEFRFDSSFPRQFWGFAVPSNRSDKKNVLNVVLEFALFCLCRGLE